MATKNPRVVGYIQPATHEKLKQFMEEYGVSESKALDLILGEYFGVDVPRVASSSTLDVDSKINEAINQGLAQAIAPLQNQIEEIRGAVVYNGIQTVIESLTSRIEQLEQRIQSEESEETGEPITAIEPGIVKNQSELTEVLNLISRRQLDAAAKKGIEVTAKDGSVWRFEGREPGGNGAKNFRCVSPGKQEAA